MNSAAKFNELTGNNGSQNYEQQTQSIQLGTYYTQKKITFRNSARSFLST